MCGIPAGARTGDGATGPALRLDIRNDIEAVCGALAEVEAFLAGQGVDEEAAFTVRLTVEELATNVVKYAYADGVPHEIGIEVLLSADRATIRVIDDGRPFDPLLAPAPDLDAPIERKSVGGVGIHLLRNMCETLSYSRAGGTNRVTATVRRTPNGGARC